MLFSYIYTALDILESMWNMQKQNTIFLEWYTDLCYLAIMFLEIPQTQQF